MLRCLGFPASVRITWRRPFPSVSFGTTSVDSSSPSESAADCNAMDSEEERQKLIAEITKKLRGPLADDKGNVPTGSARPIAVEVDGPSHFYVNTTKYTAYTKLKHRLLTRMGYKVLHVPYFEWRKLRGGKERENYMTAKLKEEPTEWLDPSDEKYYSERLLSIEKEMLAMNEKKSNSQPQPPSGPRPG